MAALQQRVQQYTSTRTEQLEPAARDALAHDRNDRGVATAIDGHAKTTLKDADKEWILFPNVKQSHDINSTAVAKGKGKAVEDAQVSPASRNDGAITSSWSMLDDPTQGWSTPQAASVTQKPPSTSKARRQGREKKRLQDSLFSDVLASDDENGDSSTQWGSLPRQEGDGSFLFPEDETQNASTAAVDHGGSAMMPSLYASTLAAHRQPGADLMSAAASTAAESEMLSLPSSLSAISSTEDTTSRNGSSSLPSPIFRDKPPKAQRQREPSAALTEAALSRHGEAADRLSGGEYEAGLTSGSDNDGDREYADADEDLLSRTPGAQSAGIRAVRASRRQRKASNPLQPIALSQTSDNHGLVAERAESVVSGKSAYKRRHRHAGISDKGSKRSHTGSVRQTARGSDVGNTSNQYPSASRSPKLGSLERLRETAAAVFQIEEEVMEAVAGTSGTIYEQAYTPRRSRRHSRAVSYSSTYARSNSSSALSAHVAAELGESSGIHQMFSRPVYSAARHSHYLSEDEGGDAYDSGADTETERHHAHRAVSSPVRKTFPRLPRRSALSAWEAACVTMDSKTRCELEVFLKTHEPDLWAEVSKPPRYTRDNEEEEDEHTRSLGLEAYHRHPDFSIAASLQQILFRGLPAVLGSLR